MSKENKNVVNQVDEKKEEKVQAEVVAEACETTLTEEAPKKEGILKKAKNFVGKHKVPFVIGGIAAAVGGGVLLGRKTCELGYVPENFGESEDEEDESGFDYEPNDFDDSDNEEDEE